MRRIAVQVELAPVDDLAQVGARHEAHGQVEHALELAAAMDRDDVRVLERGRQARLGLEAGDRVRVLGVLGRDDLQRHGAVQIGVGGLVDDAHPAAIEHALDAVARELRARLEPGQAIGGLVHPGAMLTARIAATRANRHIRGLPSGRASGRPAPARAPDRAWPAAARRPPCPAGRRSLREPSGPLPPGRAAPSGPPIRPRPQAGSAPGR